jgi:hypothetical protein
MPRWFEFLRRTPCLVLLVVQLAGVLLYPTMETSPTGRSVFALFGLLVLVLVLLTLRVTPFISWVATLGALPAAGLLLVSVFVDDERLFALSAAFEMAVYFYAALSMLAYMLQDDEVTTDELFAIPAGLTPAGLGVRVPVRGGPGPRSRWFQPRRRGQEVVDGTALPLVHHPLQHGPLGHHSHLRPRAQCRHARAGHGRLLHRDGGHPPGVAPQRPRGRTRTWLTAR